MSYNHNTIFFHNKFHNSTIFENRHSQNSIKIPIFCGEVYQKKEQVRPVPFEAKVKNGWGRENRHHIHICYYTIKNQICQPKQKRAENSALCILLLEVSIKKSFKRLAVSCLIASHFVNGVVDCVEVKSLCALCEVELAHCCAVFCFNSHFKVLLC